MNFRKDYRFFFLGIAIICVGIMIPYWIYFGTNRISNRIEDWNFFITYLNYLISPMLLFFTVFYSLQSIDEIRRQGEQQSIESYKQREIDNLVKVLEEQSRVIDQRFEKVIFYRSIPGPVPTPRGKKEFRDLYYLDTTVGPTLEFFLDEDYRHIVDIEHYFEGIILDLFNLSIYLLNYRSILGYPSNSETMYASKYGYYLIQFLMIENSYFKELLLDKEAFSQEEIREKTEMTKRILELLKPRIARMVE